MSEEHTIFNVDVTNGGVMQGIFGKVVDALVERSTLASRVVELSDQIAKLSEEVHNLKDTIMRLELELAAERREKMEAVETLEGSRSIASGLATDLTNAQSTMGELRTQLSEERQKSFELGGKLRGASADLDSMREDRDYWKRRYDVLADENNQQSSLIEKQKEEIAKLEQKNAELTSTIQRINEVLGGGLVGTSISPGIVVAA